MTVRIDSDLSKYVREWTNMVPCDNCNKDVASVFAYTDSQGGYIEICCDCCADLLDSLISRMTGAQLRQALDTLRAEKGQAPLVPGKAGTVPAESLSLFAMGDGTGKECRVVRNGMVCLYVGIGWIKERQARQEDCDMFPMIA